MIGPALASGLVFDKRRNLRRRHGCHPSLLIILIVLCLHNATLLLGDEPESLPPHVSRFGQRYLKNADLVAEVEIGQIYHMGMGVDVVRMKVGRVLLNRLPPDLAQQKTHLMLAYRDEFLKGTKLLLVLKRFGASDRLVKTYRLSHLDINYKEKVRLIREYLQVEEIKDKKGKIEALVKLVLTNLKDESTWIKWNSLYELQGIFEEKRWSFTSGDVVYLRDLEKETKIPELKRSISDLCDAMAAQAKEGPPILDQESKNNHEEAPQHANKQQERDR